MNKKIFIVGLMVLTVLIASACAITDMASGKRVSLNVTLTEKQINDLIQRTSDNLNAGEDVLLKEITSVDLQSGKVKVFGTYDRPDGIEAEGSYDFGMDVQDGQLRVQVVAVDIVDLSMNDPRVTNLNKRLTQEFSQAANESGGQFRFEDVIISDTDVKIMVSIQAETP